MPLDFYPNSQRKLDQIRGDIENNEYMGFIYEIGERDLNRANYYKKILVSDPKITTFGVKNLLFFSAGIISPLTFIGELAINNTWCFDPVA